MLGISQKFLGFSSASPLRIALQPLREAPEGRAPRAAVRRELRRRQLRQGEAARGAAQVVRDEDLGVPW